MADIVKKTGRELVASGEWDPFRMMREWSPWNLQRGTFNPTFDVTETKEAFVFKADVPGVKAEDLEITTKDNRIQIAGKRDLEHEEKSDTVYMYEREYGNFMRVFTLPEGADIAMAKTDLKDGVLTLVVPKKPGTLPRKIEIASGKTKS